MRKGSVLTVNSRLIKLIGFRDAVVFTKILDLTTLDKSIKDKNGFFTATYSYIGEEIGMSRTTVSRAVSNLKKYRFIETVLVRGRGKEIYLRYLTKSINVKEAIDLEELPIERIYERSQKKIENLINNELIEDDKEEL